MDTLARRIGEMLVLRGAASAVARWGLMRVVGVAGLAALAGYYLFSHKKDEQQQRLLPAPDAGERSASSGWPGEDRRRAPELEPGMTYPGERRTLH
ncbi:hypothetical protein ASD15_21160 [Massilia sp. Root351]|jgi:hypothetical protein|uniref:hypothetical protein n=1 Tax=Massilia sp. Root351 TaxID=1736522 RepID=UPI0007103B1D|nr:hypothetical protein [Massilia sp. Root351]KQV79167.1 hypothetical protein ASD15_21160 [Massilia sp. Root351]